MSLIRIRMDSTSLSIDGDEVGSRSNSFGAIPITTWDSVRQVLDGFDIDQPLRDKERIAQLETEVKDLNTLIANPMHNVGETAV